MEEKATSDKNKAEKIFVISLHRTMTRSVDAYLSILGYQTIHYPKYIQGVNIEEKFRGIEHQPEKVVSLLNPIIESADALSDIPFPTLYQQLADKWIKSKFILVQRDPPGWVQSVRNHLKDRPLSPFDKIQYGPYLGFNIDNLKNVSDQKLQTMYNQHTYEVDKFFTDIGERHRLCIINSIDESAEKISQFLGQPVFEMPWIAGGKKGDPEIPSLQYWKYWCPEKADPCYYLAKIYYEQGNYLQSQTECQKAVELDPTFHKPYRLLSKIDKKKKYFWLLRLKQSLAHSTKNLKNKKPK